VSRRGAGQRPPGRRPLAARGFLGLAALAARGRQGVPWLARWQGGTAVAPAGGAPQALPARRGAPPRSPARLPAARVKGPAGSAARWRRGGGAGPLTNVPAARLPPQAAPGRARPRGQTALPFTPRTGRLRADEWRSATPWRLRTEGYATRLAAPGPPWLGPGGGGHQPARSPGPAARALQAHPPPLAAGFDACPGRCQARRTGARPRAAAGRLTKRQAAPATTRRRRALDALPFACCLWG
jgi:hypothetical protein